LGRPCPPRGHLRELLSADRTIACNAGPGTVVVLIKKDPVSGQRVTEASTYLPERHPRELCKEHEYQDEAIRRLRELDERRSRAT
jgi:hypothetical protein